ncbi:hypothetical protein TGRH88_036260 [Toxoplasma gondii]|uniref:Uncharacterized protein n=1 Tax=Toxoplasma gondii TaxID=5811 RepID=A0A7J6K748_TOXGO|nr:hypothetical protein TGRH88_036260 [Toxoplasma gondii]
MLASCDASVFAVDADHQSWPTYRRGNWWPAAAATGDDDADCRLRGCCWRPDEHGRNFARFDGEQRAGGRRCGDGHSGGADRRCRPLQLSGASINKSDGCLDT